MKTKIGNDLSDDEEAGHVDTDKLTEIPAGRIEYVAVGKEGEGSKEEEDDSGAGGGGGEPSANEGVSSGFEDCGAEEDEDDSKGIHWKIIPKECWQLVRQYG